MPFFINYFFKSWISYKLQTEASPTFAHGSNKTCSHIQLTIQILCNSITPNSVISSFLSSFGWYWPHKIFQKIYYYVSSIFCDALQHITWKKPRIVRVTAKWIWAGTSRIRDCSFVERSNIDLRLWEHILHMKNYQFTLKKIDSFNRLYENPPLNRLIFYSRISSKTVRKDIRNNSAISLSLMAARSVCHLTLRLSSRKVVN